MIDPETAPSPPVSDHIVSLIAAIESNRERVHTTSLDISFNELLDMHINQELDISPDYQRLFQWSEGARSRFIESLLLEMPVPPIYVVEEEGGKYMLIDGLQRISSYLHLRGELDALHLDTPVEKGRKLIFVDCDIVPELNGKTFDDLGTALQIRLKRSFVRVEVLRKGSDPRFKYHMFKRLNSGGMLLSPQQLRNCTIRLLSPIFNDFIIELSQGVQFRNCIDSITFDQLTKAFDQELVLRFFAFKNDRDRYIHDIADFLTEYMEGVSEPVAEQRIPFDFEAERATFEHTFAIFDKTLQERSFCYANRALNTVTSGFSVYHFEAFTLGIQDYLPALDPNNEVEMDRLKGLFTQIKLNPDFYALTSGGGKNSRNQLSARIQYVKDAVDAHL